MNGPQRSDGAALNRWRLVLGKNAQDQMPLEGGPKLARMDDALDFLYSREAGPDVRDDISRERQGGSGASQTALRKDSFLPIIRVTQAASRVASAPKQMSIRP